MKIQLNRFKSLDWEGDIRDDDDGNNWGDEYDDETLTDYELDDLLHSSNKKVEAADTIISINTVKSSKMTAERRLLLKTIMEWYWSTAQNSILITKSDYEFVYSIWNSGITIYTNDVQDRLNKIRDIYIKSTRAQSKKLKNSRYGIEIVKPWSLSMYNHNDKVSFLMKLKLTNVLNNAYNLSNEVKLRELAVSISGHKYGTGYDLQTIYEITLKELDMMENYRLNEEYAYLVKKNIVRAVEMDMIGY